MILNAPPYLPTREGPGLPFRPRAGHCSAPAATAAPPIGRPPWPQAPTCTGPELPLLVYVKKSNFITVETFSLMLTCSCTELFFSLPCTTWVFIKGLQKKILQRQCRMEFLKLVVKWGEGALLQMHKYHTFIDKA